MRKMKQAAILIALILGSSAWFAACSSGDDEENDTDELVCDADNQGATRCEGNVVVECRDTRWVAKSNCTATSEFCAMDDTNGAACGAEAPVCEGADEQEFVCLDSNMIMCNAPEGNSTFPQGGDNFYQDCADTSLNAQFPAVDPTAAPGECYDYGDRVVTEGGPWGSDCLLPEGRACAYVITTVVRLGCGDGGEVDPDLACDEALGCVPLTTGVCSASGFVCDGNNLVGCQVPSEFFGFNLGPNISFGCDHEVYGSGTCDPQGYDDGAGELSPACVHETEGGFCDGLLVLCGGSLTCSPDTFTCETP